MKKYLYLHQLSQGQVKNKHTYRQAQLHSTFRILNSKFCINEGAAHLKLNTYYLIQWRSPLNT